MSSLVSLFAGGIFFIGCNVAFAGQVDTTVPSVSPDEQYIQGPDSQAQLGVPKGELFEFTFDHSMIFPGTSRRITVYVPAYYTGRAPACVYVALDELGFEAPTVFDNLIYKHEMPVTIAIGIQSGVVNSSALPRDPRFNRSFEFDGLNDNLARFVLDEVLPEVERRTTPRGLPILLSRSPNDRAVSGASTGGIGAFTLAWERPNEFRRVFTAIGTFVGMRGGDRYPVLVRKTEPKPLRIFMQDGANDEWMGGPEVGDWWMSNQSMERALEFAGYIVRHEWGEGKHSVRHATAIFPEAMRWLWKDWPQPVTAGDSRNVVLKAILQPGEAWKPVAAGDSIAAALAVGRVGHKAWGSNGRVYETDPTSGKIWLIRGADKVAVDSDLKGPTGIALSPDGLWLAVAESKTHWGYSYRVLADGTVGEKQRFYWFHVPDDADDSGVGAWVMDKEGRLYAATRMGIQVFDRNGRVRAIIPVPGVEVIDVLFGGDRFDTLYAKTIDGKTYQRKFKVPGIPPGAPSIELPKWGPG